MFDDPPIRTASAMTIYIPHLICNINELCVILFRPSVYTGIKKKNITSTL